MLERLPNKKWHYTARHTPCKGWIRRLGGKNWQRLHRLIYLTGILAVVHYIWLVKADLRKPIGQQPETRQGIEIGDDVWIATGCRILDGVKIGRGCVVGAGAVVTQSLPDYSIAVGVPARIVGNRLQRAQQENG